LNDLSLSLLLGILFLLILLSAFFSGSETALMTLNRYRLQHLAKSNHAGALRAQKLLQRPDRLIGLILLGNNFVNILASSIATVIAMRVWGEAGIAIAAGILTLVILIFAEVTPKTLAAINPEKLAFPAALIYTPLLKLLYPLVWIVNLIANQLLKLIGVDVYDEQNDALSHEELRTVVVEAGVLIPQKHQKMLLNILDMESATVEDIMIPRGEIVGIDLDNHWDEVLKKISQTPYTRIPIYRKSIDNIIGVLHLRKALGILTDEDFNKNKLIRCLSEPYFIPEATSLHKQLFNFQKEKMRMGLVVDEYGDILGAVTLEDLLEEIVGEFTTDPSEHSQEVQQQKDGGYLVEGSVTIRELNKITGWSLPTNGPKTLNGLILEYLETIPKPGTSLKLLSKPLEIIQTQGNAVKLVRFYPTKQ